LLQHCPLPVQAVPLGRLHSPGLPVVQQMLGALQTTAVPVQVPFWQVSPLVQALPSLQVVPFGLFCSTQLPVAGSQTLTLHWFAFAGQVFVDATVQVPLWQVWVVQALPSVLQEVPFALFCVWQIPEVALQTLS